MTKVSKKNRESLPRLRKTGNAQKPNAIFEEIFPQLPPCGEVICLEITQGHTQLRFFTLPTAAWLGELLQKTKY